MQKKFLFGLLISMFGLINAAEMTIDVSEKIDISSDNIEIKNEEIGERTEEEQEQADKAGETKTPSVLAENNTVTFIDEDGTEQNGTVTFIDRGKGDIIKSVVIAPNQGYGREIEVGPENILNENSKSRSPYKSAQLRELEQQLKIAHDQGNITETGRLRKAVEEQQKIEMDITLHSKGVYYLQLTVGKEIFVKQILKN